MRTEHLCHVEAARRFTVFCDKLVASWEHIYLEECLGGLSIEGRGRKSTDYSPKSKLGGAVHEGRLRYLHNAFSV